MPNKTLEEYSTSKQVDYLIKFMLAKGIIEDVSEIEEYFEAVEIAEKLAMKDENNGPFDESASTYTPQHYWNTNASHYNAGNHQVYVSPQAIANARAISNNHSVSSGACNPCSEEKIEESSLWKKLLKIK